MLTLTLVLMLVTAPLVDGSVVNRPPMGQVRTPPAPVKHEVTVDVVRTVVVVNVGVGVTVIVVVSTGASGVA